MTERKRRQPGGPKPKPPKRTSPHAGYKITKKDRDRVVRLKAYGWSNPEIAHYLGIGEISLLNHFERELEFGRQEKREEMELRMEKLAKRGYFPAQKYLREVTMGIRPIQPSVVAALEHRAGNQAQEIEAEIIEPQGKKQLEQAMAEQPNQDTEMGRLMARRQASVADPNKLN